MKIGIILGTNELSGLMFASIEAGMRASMGDEVIMFVTMDGLKAFMKKPEIKITTTSSKLISEKDPDWTKSLKEGKNDGFLNIYACYYACQIYDVDKKDMGELVSDVWGITKFAIETEDAQVITIW
jgi:peroxiredoxin family protein